VSPIQSANHKQNCMPVMYARVACLPVAMADRSGCSTSGSNPCQPMSEPSHSSSLTLVSSTASMAAASWSWVSASWRRRDEISPVSVALRFRLGWPAGVRNVAEGPHYRGNSLLKSLLPAASLQTFCLFDGSLTVALGVWNWICRGGTYLSASQQSQWQPPHAGACSPLTAQPAPAGE
jgi:hypothetical protein